jgi:hypothetical protein
MLLHAFIVEVNEEANQPLLNTSTRRVVAIDKQGHTYFPDMGLCKLPLVDNGLSISFTIFLTDSEQSG